jgi:hypothetical protein
MWQGVRDSGKRKRRVAAEPQDAASSKAKGKSEGDDKKKRAADSKEKADNSNDSDKSKRFDGPSVLKKRVKDGEGRACRGVDVTAVLVLSAIANCCIV